tara:strand:- start:4256 stop:5395 length:1140 start_codon:yes stop_codon:yes gene_type:complete
MKIVVAPDSFKESLSAKAVCNIISKAIAKVIPEATVLQIPISDGGEGLLEALVSPLKGTLVHVTVKDPLLRNISANYGLIDQGNTAIIEMATASGLELLLRNERNPLITSSYGTGQLIKDALDKGCRKIIIGIGGSATNDGGMGMIRALGGAFLDSNGNDIPEGGGAMGNLHKIDLSSLDKRLTECEIICACDVSNILTGKQGASFIYGPQKGAKKEDLILLDNNLTNYAYIIKTNFKKDMKNIAGTGAAGGMGMALLVFLDAKLINGIELIIDTLQLENHIKNANLVITGEGKIDKQTLSGKTIMGISRIAKKNKVPVIAFCGSVGRDIGKIYDHGLHSIFPIVNKPMKLENAIKNSKSLLSTCVENVLKSLKDQKKL